MSRTARLGLFALAICVVSAATASANTYYIAANGSDSNNGTSKTSPWKHAPGMQNCTNNCAGVTPGPDDQIIFKGCDTWGPTNWPMLPPGSGGTAGHTLYFGVDKTWYTGGAWCRPIFSGGGTYPGTISSGWPAGHVLTFDYLSYWVVDGIEFTGFYYNTSVNGVGSSISCANGASCTNYEVKNCYVHGWTHGVAGTDIGAFIWGSNGPYNNASSAHDNVIDGSDTTKDSFSVFAGGPGIIYRNYANYIFVFANINTTVNSIHDNWANNLACSYDGVSHGDTIQVTPPNQNIVYNNYFAHTGNCAFSYNPQAGANTTNYVFNNVYSDTNIVGGGVALGVYAGGAQANVVFYAFNNTIEPNSDSGSGPSNGMVVVDDSVNSVSSIYNVYNNHGITSGSLTAVYSSGGSYTLNQSNNLLQSKAAANAAGYTSGQTWAFSPTSGGSPTVGAGVNETSLCNSIPDATAKTACLSDTTLGVAYDAANHTVLAGSFRTPIPRPSSGAWDVGAYQYQYSAGPNPPENLTAVVR